MNDETMASELLHELKASARRWFVIAMAELVVIAVLVFVMFFVPVEEYETTVEQDAQNTERTMLVGGDYNGTADNTNELQETENNR